MPEPRRDTCVGDTTPLKFTYRNLSKTRVIRLLKLDPNAPKRATGFQLKTFWLDEAPEYYALSYAWGTPDRAASIVCNGERLPVTRNLKAGIDELLGTEALVRCWIWIDQVCINQDDAEERSHQVQLMRHIYKGAVRTVVWLGPSTDPADEAFALAEKVYAVCQMEEFSSLPPWTRNRRLNSSAIPRIPYQALGVPPLEAEVWKELLSIVERPWFRRIWIIQELALSTKPPMLVYCTRPRNILHLLTAASLFVSASLFAGDLQLQRPRPLVLATNLIDIMGAKYPFGLNYYLGTILTFEATDLRDYIYGVLGLAAETSGPPDSWPAALVPDYTLPAGELYRRVTAHVIGDSGSLLILHRVYWGDPKAQAAPLAMADGAALPSWVVRFDLRASQIGTIKTWPLPGGSWYVGYVGKAGNARAAVVRHSDAHPRVLGLRGLAIAKIRFVSSDPRGEELGRPRLFHLFTEAAQNLRSDDWLLRAWAEHLGVEVPPVDFSETMGQFLAVWSVYLGKILCSADFMWYMFWKRVITSERGIVEINRSYPDMLYVEFFASSQDLQLFITEDDRVCLGRRTVQTGDLVCVLFGGDMPFVLRPAGAQYILIGPCTAHGLMRGEAIDMMNAGRLEERWFDLI